MKKTVIALVVVFVCFWLVTDPRGLAHTTSSTGGGAWGVTQDLFHSLITFLREL